MLTFNNTKNFVTFKNDPYDLSPSVINYLLIKFFEKFKKLSADVLFT